MNRYMDYILSIPKAVQETGQPALPPGYRFHPTDEELVVFYLNNKVSDSSFTVAAIADADLNRCEPWELPEKAKMGEREWYFFCLKDRKYPSGMRTNRATEAGYWKATGKDREVTSSRHDNYTVGMKKTLVFYKGRAPKGEKTSWIMHEYRLEGASPLVHLSKAMKDEWVVCRVFRKNLSGKKMAASISDTKPVGFSLPALLESPRTIAGGDEMSGLTDSETVSGLQLDIIRNPSYPSINKQTTRYPELLFNDGNACFNRLPDDQIHQPLASAAGDSSLKSVQVVAQLAMPAAIPASGSVLNAFLEQYSNSCRPPKLEPHLARTISPDFISKHTHPTAWTSFASHQIPPHMISPATFNHIPPSSRLVDGPGHSYFNDYQSNIARSVTDQLRGAPQHDLMPDNLWTSY